jgi:hypothetical protein
VGTLLRYAAAAPLLCVAVGALGSRLGDEWLYDSNRLENTDAKGEMVPNRAGSVSIPPHRDVEPNVLSLS